LNQTGVLLVTETLLCSLDVFMPLAFNFIFRAFISNQ